MAEDQPLIKKRAEILFDVLRGQDKKDETHPGSENNASSSSTLSNIEHSKPKDNTENSSGSILMTGNNDVNKVADISKYKGLLQEIDNRSSVQELCSGLRTENSLTTRCQSALGLAVFCRSQLSKEDCDLVFNALHIMSDQHTFHALSFCQALLLYVLTKQNLSSEQIVTLEKSILKVAHSVIHSDGMLGNNFVQARIILLGGERYLTACKLCKEMFPEENLDVNSLDVTSICCSSFRSLSKLISTIPGRWKFSDATLKYISNMIGISTQEIISENLIDMEEEEEVLSLSSYTVHQCLQVLEQIVLTDVSSAFKTLEHEEFSLIRCLTKLLEWSLLSLFPQETSENNAVKMENSLQTFHRTTLVSILKVFTILSFDPVQYYTYTSIKGSMEKIMICILKTYFESQDNCFDVLALALELMINLAFKSKKTFVLLCVKKFQINRVQKVLAIEALLKIVENSLENINKLKSRSTENVEEGTSQSESNESENDATSSEDSDLEVLKAADKDMELSTLVSFIGILLMIFIDTKKSFLEFVKEKFPEEKCLETVVVIKKFLQFTLLTGGMPPTGMFLLRSAMRKLDGLHSST